MAKNGVDGSVQAAHNDGRTISFASAHNVKNYEEMSNEVAKCVADGERKESWGWIWGGLRLENGVIVQIEVRTEDKRLRPPENSNNVD